MKIKVEKENGGVASRQAASEINDGAVSSSLKITPSFISTWVRQTRLSNGKKHFEVLPLAEDDLLKTAPEIKLTNKEIERLRLYREFVREKVFQ